jgi:hypothetical protein
VVKAEQEAAEPAAPTPDTAAGAPIDADPRTDPIPTQQP